MEQVNAAADFERHMKRLEEIVTRLESGKLSLEESISLYSEGAELSQACRNAVKNARLSVKTINRSDDKGDRGE